MFKKLLLLTSIFNINKIQGMQSEHNICEPIIKYYSQEYNYLFSLKDLKYEEMMDDAIYNLNSLHNEYHKDSKYGTGTKHYTGVEFNTNKSNPLILTEEEKDMIKSPNGCKKVFYLFSNVPRLYLPKNFLSIRSTKLKKYINSEEFYEELLKTKNTTLIDECISLERNALFTEKLKISNKNFSQHEGFSISNSIFKLIKHNNQLFEIIYPIPLTLDNIYNLQKKTQIKFNKSDFIKKIILMYFNYNDIGDESKTFTPMYLIYTAKIIINFDTKKVKIQDPRIMQNIENNSSTPINNFNNEIKEKISSTKRTIENIFNIIYDF